MNTPAGQEMAARTLEAANKAGHLAVADYANTRNPKLISADGTKTWAVFDMPRPSLDCAWRWRASQVQPDADQARKAARAHSTR
jgi:hypothetical protein